ncbi:hypothetical protein [Thomasclavelia cocleata]|uniref:hypothetical protein n=1 Tax=Thomasclavelia cocleata TaxID=69824 RepID=UPI00243303F2|nr:hypothetical protein [Thomasclavelia cocleata]
MKCIRKILIILFICFQINDIYAENESIIIYKHVLDDKHIEVVIFIDEKIQVAGGSFVFTYNNEKLTIESVQYDINQNMYIVANKDYKNEGNKIKITFASVDVVKGRIAVIVFSNKEDNIDQNDVIVQQCKVSDENGIVSKGINETAIASIITKGDSVIDENMDYIDKSIAKIEDKEKKKEIKKTEIKGDNDNVYIFMILSLVILVVGLVAFKNKRK